MTRGSAIGVMLVALAVVAVAMRAQRRTQRRRPLGLPGPYREPDDGVPTSGHPTWATSVPVEPLSWDAVVAWPYPKSWPELAD